MREDLQKLGGFVYARRGGTHKTERGTPKKDMEKNKNQKKKKKTRGVLLFAGKKTKATTA